MPPPCSANTVAPGRSLARRAFGLRDATAIAI